MRTATILLLLVSLIAGNLLAFGHAHAAAGDLHVLASAVDGDGPGDHGPGESGHCDVCGHTCAQPGSVMTTAAFEVVHKPVLGTRRDVIVEERPFPVLLEPPTHSLRR